MYPWYLNSNSQHTLLTTGQWKIARCSKKRKINSTVNFTSVEKLRTLRIAWLHRKVMVEDFLTQYAVFNGREIYCKQDSAVPGRCRGCADYAGIILRIIGVCNNRSKY